MTLIGGSALLVSDFLSLPESEGVYFPGPESNFSGNTNEATGKAGDKLFGDYREKYGEAPTSAYLAHAYDTATILLRAIDDVAVAMKIICSSTAPRSGGPHRHQRFQRHHWGLLL